MQMMMLTLDADCGKNCADRYMSSVHFNRVILEGRVKNAERNVYIVSRGLFFRNNVVVPSRTCVRKIGKSVIFLEVLRLDLKVTYAYDRSRNAFSEAQAQSGASVRTP